MGKDNPQIIPSLVIHKLSQAQYDREKEAGRLDPNAIYLTPNVGNEVAELSNRVDTLEDDLGKKADSSSLNGLATETYVDEKVGQVDIPSALSELTEDETHRVVTDSEKATWNAKSEFSGSYSDLTDKPTIPSIEGLASETFVNDAKTSAISTAASDATTKVTTHNVATDAHNDIRVLISDLTTQLNNFLDVATDTEGNIVDELSEVLTLINNNKGTLESLTTNKINVTDIIDNLTTASANKVLSANQGVEIKKLIDALQISVDGKANTSHTHTIANVTDLQTTLDGKSNTGHTHTASEINNLVGENVTGTSYTIDGSTVTAGDGAEIFNDYRDRTYDENSVVLTGNVASGNYSHAEGAGTTASGHQSHAEGVLTIASKSNAHAEGNSTIANANNAHAEGYYATASGAGSHAEGDTTTASGKGSHAEGASTTASGEYTHAEGGTTVASGSYSHAEGNNTMATKVYSHAEGYYTKATGKVSHAEGHKGEAYGDYSHVEGASSNRPSDVTTSTDNIEIITGWKTKNFSLAKGNGSHSEGTNTLALGSYSHAEGNRTIVIGNNAHVEGHKTTVIGDASHAEGYQGEAYGVYSHVEGYSKNKVDDVITITADTTNDEILSAWNSNYFSLAKGESSHVEGRNSLTLGDYSHAEGTGTKASGEEAHAEGYLTEANGICSHAEGSMTKARGNYSHAEGQLSLAGANYAHAEGYLSRARSESSHAEGYETTASGAYSHAEGWRTTASGTYSHAGGRSSNEKSSVTESTNNTDIQTAWKTTKFSLAKGEGSYVEGQDCLALGNQAHAEGYQTIASGNYGSHAEGGLTTASGWYSHAEGSDTTASGDCSHTEGEGTVASNTDAHAEGYYAVADAFASHAEGKYTKASSEAQHTQGKYNIEDTASKYAHIVGNGESDTARSNAHTLDWNGNAWFAGKVYIGGTSQDDATELGAGGGVGASGTGANSEIFNDYTNNKANTDYAHAEGSQTWARGITAHAEGYNSHADGDYSHAEGYETTASTNANYSHAEGYKTITKNNFSHAEGQNTTASGGASHAEGAWTEAGGQQAHAEGFGTTAGGCACSAHGYKTTASGSNAEGIVGYAQAVFGKYNTIKYSPSSDNTQDSTNADALFIVGCGTSSATKNAFRVTSGGKCYGTTSFGSSGADFAELFEWADGNPDNEDRRGLFVTLDGERIRLANADDDYIGIISDNQAFIGNSASEEWQGKYLTDIFGGKLTQEVEVPEVIDEVTGEVIHEATTTTQYVLNPDYDPNEEYIMRENRKEWGIVGLVGQIVLIDDGSCVVGGRVVPKENGIGTASTTKEGYRVMARLDDTHIKVLVK